MRKRSYFSVKALLVAILGRTCRWYMRRIDPNLAFLGDYQKEIKIIQRDSFEAQRNKF